MAQIQAGITYTDGAQVTASNLNAHVNNAVLVPGAISTQSAATTCTISDGLLILQGGALKQATVSQLPFINKDGSVAMTGELTLSSSSPAGSLSAAPVVYVDTNLATKQASLGFTPVNKAGDTGVGALTLTGALTLPADPSSALQATTKQYVDTGLATKQASLGFTPVNKAGDTGVGALTLTGALTLAADPVSSLQASTKAYVDAQVTAAGPSLVPAGAVMAFYRSTPPTGWIECNGQSVASYPNLVSLGLTVAPDLRGEFVRGWDNGKGTDPGRTLGTWQNGTLAYADIGASNAVAGLQGSATTNQTTARGILGFDAITASNYTGANLLAVNATNGITINEAMTSTEGVPGSSRPRNIALMYCIKT